MRRPERARDRPWATIGALLLVLALIVIGVVFMASERARRLAASEPVEIELREYVILPGQEQVVRDWLAPLEHGALASVEQFSFALEHNVVQVQLFGPSTNADTKPACPGPEWVRPPAALLLSRAAPQADARDGPGTLTLRQGDLWMVVHGCGDIPEHAFASLLERMAKAPELAHIWQPAAPTIEPEPATPARESGLLSPVAEALGLARESLTMLMLVLGCALSLLVAGVFARQLPGPVPIAIHGPRSRWWIVAALLLVGVAVRLHFGVERPFDSDESWAKPSVGSIFGENHDPWVHPPLFHLLAQPWARAIAWAPGDPLWLLRLPSIALGLLATSAVIVYVGARARALWVCLFALPCAMATTLASTLVLARPYALAVALLVVCTIALWPIATRDEPIWTIRARWALILTTAGLAAWTDVIAGVAASVLVLGRLLAEPRRRTPAALAVLAVLGVWLAPLIPGALEAATHHIDPEIPQALIEELGIEPPADVRPDPQLTRQLPSFCVFGIAVERWTGVAVALGLAGLLAWVGWRGRSHRIEAGLPLAMMLLWLLIASSLVHLRPRNVAFAPVLGAVLATVGIRRPRRGEPPPE